MECGKDYILRETTAPKGYDKIKTDIKISVSEDGSISTKLGKSKDKNGNVVYLVKNTKSKKPAADDRKPPKKDSNGVKTGDETSLKAWLMMMAAAITGLGAMIFRRRRTDKDQSCE
jgi:LPXTG-motif cell wall-anchored protein